MFSAMLEAFTKQLKTWAQWLLIAFGVFFGVFLFGKASVPTELKTKDIKKAKKEVQDDQANKDTFDLLNDMDESIDLL